MAASFCTEKSHSRNAAGAAATAGNGANDAAFATGGDAGTSAGCGHAPPTTGDFHLQTTDGNGASRDYEVIVPPAYDPAKALDLVFVYHGAGSDEAAAVAFGLQNAPGAAGAAIFVFPQGVPYKNDGVGWDDSCGGYDMAFFDRMLAYLEGAYCIDESRVFAAGFSWGCDFVTGLTCCRGNRIRAVGVASCSDDFSDTSNYKTYIDSPCPALGATAIRFTHDANGDTGYTKQDFTTTSELYRSFNECSSTWAAASPAPCESYAGCSAPFIECPYPNLGHTIPPSWASDTWAFFSSL